MANKLDMSEANFSSYERDKSEPPSEKLKQISLILNVSTDYLLGRTENPFPSGTEKEFYDSIDLDDEFLLEKFQLEYNGKPLTQDQAKRAISLLRSILQHDQQ